MRLLLDRLASPIGAILLVHDEAGALRALDFDDFEARMRRLLRGAYGHDETAPARADTATVAGLSAYFAGEFGALAGIAVQTAGTPFQRTVWGALRRLPPGATISYGALAAGIGRPQACRAVGGANGANPVAIVVPCHRVVGASGALTGFGGGTARKAWLLRHEAAWAG